MSVICPFCEKESKEMLAHGEHLEVFKKYEISGGGYRLNCRCPHCNSIDRDRLVYLYLKQCTGILTDSCTVLHCAPEVKIFNILKKLPHCEYVTADISSSLAILKVDIVALPFENNRFDYIICNHVLEHIADDIRAMKELYRILKPGGQAVMQVPYSAVLEKTYEDFSITLPAERKQVFGQEDHVRIYGKDYILRLAIAGFSVKEFDYTSEFGRFECERYAINNREIVFVGRK